MLKFSDSVCDNHRLHDWSPISQMPIAEDSNHDVILPRRHILSPIRQFLYTIVYCEKQSRKSCRSGCSGRK